eukprot:TRINITY_DN6231_c0_g1_i2.p1 TRINITY_DN6231_c0_g1~~TRINITY_DN6231_c0_g1_i2.p1  ORF type:complete len:454 (-),score=89.59 TRINITY_DN6231_c0_g1_i2:8-1369(-)
MFILGEPTIDLLFDNTLTISKLVKDRRVVLSVGRVDLEGKLFYYWAKQDELELSTKYSKVDQASAKFAGIPSIASRYTIDSVNYQKISVPIGGFVYNLLFKQPDKGDETLHRVIKSVQFGKEQHNHTILKSHVFEKFLISCPYTWQVNPTTNNLNIEDPIIGYLSYEDRYSWYEVTIVCDKSNSTRIETYEELMKIQLEKLGPENSITGSDTHIGKYKGRILHCVTIDAAFFVYFLYLPTLNVIFQLNCQFDPANSIDLARSTFDRIAASFEVLEPEQVYKYIDSKDNDNNNNNNHNNSSNNELKYENLVWGYSFKFNPDMFQPQNLGSTIKLSSVNKKKDSVIVLCPTVTETEPENEGISLETFSAQCKSILKMQSGLTKIVEEKELFIGEEPARMMIVRNSSIVVLSYVVKVPGKWFIITWQTDDWNEFVLVRESLEKVMQSFHFFDINKI